MPSLLRTLATVTAAAAALGGLGAQAQPPPSMADGAEPFSSASKGALLLKGGEKEVVATANSQ